MCTSITDQCGASSCGHPFGRHTLPRRVLGGHRNSLAVEVPQFLKAPTSQISPYKKKSPSGDVELFLHGIASFTTYSDTSYLNPLYTLGQKRDTHLLYNIPQKPTREKPFPQWGIHLIITSKACELARCSLLLDLTSTRITGTLKRINIPSLKLGAVLTHLYLNNKIKHPDRMIPLWL